jgi:hypothetical protein
VAVISFGEYILLGQVVEGHLTQTGFKTGK